MKAFKKCFSECMGAQMLLGENEGLNASRGVWGCMKAKMLLGVYEGLNSSQIGLYGGSNAKKCRIAAMLLKCW